MECDLGENFAAGARSSSGWIRAAGHGDPLVQLKNQSTPAPTACHTTSTGPFTQVTSPSRKAELRFSDLSPDLQVVTAPTPGASIRRRPVFPMLRRGTARLRADLRGLPWAKVCRSSSTPSDDPTIPFRTPATPAVVKIASAPRAARARASAC